MVNIGQFFPELVFLLVERLQFLEQSAILFSVDDGFGLTIEQRF